MVKHSKECVLNYISSRKTTTKVFLPFSVILYVDHVFKLQKEFNVIILKQLEREALKI